MGIQGLLPFLGKSSRPTNIREYSGCTVAIDAYCWLHKGAFSCADKLARGEYCDIYVRYCMKYVYMLLSHNINPILVFDGQRLPAKADTEKKRRECRELNRQKGAELLRLNRAKEALVHLRRCVDITHEMALNLMKSCRSIGVDCIVAPYEADAQLAYMNIYNIAQLVITEDSDLLLFGAKKVLFKMDLNGNGVLIDNEKLYVAMDVKEGNFCFDKFRRMCIISGCDYLPSLPGIGLMKAFRFVKKCTDPDINRALSRMGSYLNMPLSVSKEYRDSFVKAEFMFKHQPVFDLRMRRIVPLTPIPGDVECEAVSKMLTALTDEQAAQLAYGNLDPFTLERVDHWNPDEKKNVFSHASLARRKPSNSHPSMWSGDLNSSLLAPSKKQPTNALTTEFTTRGKEIVVERGISTTPEKQRMMSDLSVQDLRLVYLSPQKAEFCQARKKLKMDGESLDLFGYEESSQKTSFTTPQKKSRNPFVVKTPERAKQLGRGALSAITSECVKNNSATVISRYFEDDLQKESPLSDDSYGSSGYGSQSLDVTKVGGLSEEGELKAKLAKIEASIANENIPKSPAKKPSSGKMAILGENSGNGGEKEDEKKWLMSPILKSRNPFRKKTSQTPKEVPTWSKNSLGKFQESLIKFSHPDAFLNRSHSSYFRNLDDGENAKKEKEEKASPKKLTSIKKCWTMGLSKKNVPKQALLAKFGFKDKLKIRADKK